jgi:hypothetical protein
MPGLRGSSLLKGSTRFIGGRVSYISYIYEPSGGFSNIIFLIFLISLTPAKGVELYQNK